MTRDRLSRVVALGTIALVVVALAIVLLGGGSNHVVYADFSDAGQLVNGDLVTVAGHQVGQVGNISLSDNGLARVELDISDDSIWPLRTGTRAEIRQLSLTGVANRFVGLTLSDSGAKVPDGGTIGLEQTKGIVDLDILLNALTPKVRTSIQQILKTGAYTFSGATPQQINQSLIYVNPALSQTAALGREVVADRFALQRLIASTADVSTALAARSGDLHGAVSETAAWLREVATQRAALQDSLVRAPGVLGQARGVLRDVSYALGVLNPTLTDLRPVAPRLAGLLRAVRPAAAGLVPTISGINQLITPATTALRGFVPKSRVAVPGLQSLTTAVNGITPILSGLRPYLPDQVAGFFEGVGGSSGPYYDANGHFARIAPIFYGTSTSLTGVASLLGGVTSKLPVLNGTQTGLLRACPGGGAPPAADGSNPWTTLDALSPVSPVCNPAEDQK